MMEQLRKIIRKYVAAARDVERRVKDETSADDIWSARVEGLLQKKGYIPSQGIQEYLFHGLGCYFEFDDTKIDIDFGPNGCVLCFDAWRLVRFSNENLGLPTLDIESVRKGLTEMMANGELYQQLDWSNELFFVRNCDDVE